MRTVSVLNLLLLIALIAVSIALWQSRVELSARDAEIARVNEAAKRLRNEVGRIEVVDPARFQIREFRQRHRRRSYALDQQPEVDFRFRVYAPDASAFEIYYKTGLLPKSGFPERGRPVFRTKRPDSEPAEVTIVARADIIDEDSNSLDIETAVQYADRNAPSRSLSTGINDSSMPWNFIGIWKCKSEKRKFKSDEPFDLDGPVLLMKKYTINAKGERQGFMMWIEPRSKPKVQ